MSRNTKQSKAAEFFSYDGTFYDVCSKAFDIIAVSLYFLIGCLPVITIGNSFTALYYATSHSIKRDEKTITQAFWHAYQINFKQSFFIELILGAAMFVFLLNTGIVSKKWGGNLSIGFTIFYSLLFAFVVATACYIFSALSRFEGEVGWFFKIAMYMVVRYLPITFLLLAIVAGCFILVWYVQPMFLLVLPGAASLLSTYILDPVLKKHMPEETI